MARQSGNSLFSSLRGKIWVSTSVLAFFICTFGLISYLVVSLLVTDVFYGVSIPFLFLAFTVMVFGWWLANEVVNPIEKVTLLAKSLERSSSASLPRRSGSTETDQLLETIHRNNQQMQTIISSMDKVANGNLDIAPVNGSDRLSISFQKLLTKVSESINAKDELDDLKEALNDLKLDISGIRTGNLNVHIGNESVATRELSHTFKYLVENLSSLIASVKKGSTSAESSVTRVESDIDSLIQKDEQRTEEMSQASIALKQVPNLIKKITEDLTGSAESARNTIERARYGTAVAAENSTSVSSLRKQVREDVKRIQSLNERSHDIERVAKTVEDLANRTNMIALNASIQATELGENGHGFVLVAEEVERLAVRANDTNKQISTLNKSILAEIKKVEDSVESTKAEVNSLSKFAIETGNVLSETERYVAQFLSLQESLIEFSQEQSEETDNAFSTFADSISETENRVETLRLSNSELGDLVKVMRSLKGTTNEFRLPDGESPANLGASNDSTEPAALNSSDSDSELYEEFASQEFTTDENQEKARDANEHQSGEDDHKSIEDVEENADEDLGPGSQMDESNSFDSLELAGAEYAGEFSESDNGDEISLEVESDDFNSLELDGFDTDEFEISNEQLNDQSDSRDEVNHAVEAKNDVVVDSEDSDVIDLYNASINAGSSASDFDSDEFSSDELIQEFDADSTELTSSEEDSNLNKLNADDLDDLLGTDSLDPAAENENNLSA